MTSSNSTPRQSAIWALALSALASCDPGCRSPSSPPAITSAAPIGPRADAAEMKGPTPPRNMWPPSTYTVGSKRPAFAWRRAPDSVQSILEVCFDRACGHVVWRSVSSGERATPDAPLDGVRLFWRVSGVQPNGQTRTGATWVFRVPPRATSAPSSRAFMDGADVDGDGISDIVFDFGVNVLRGRAGLAGSGPVDPDVTVQPPLHRPCETAPFASDGIVVWGGVRYHRPCAQFGPLSYAGDVDGDGFGDLLAEVVGGWMLVRGGAGATLSVDGTLLHAQAEPGGVLALGDIDADGFADVAFVGGDHYLYRGGPDGLSDDRRARLAPLTALSSSRVDGSGGAEIIASTREGALAFDAAAAAIVRATIDTHEALQPGPALAIPADLHGSCTLAFGDLDASGRMAIMAGRTPIADRLELFDLDFDAQPRPPLAHLMSVRRPGDVRTLRLGVTDVDGDGIQDVLVGANGEGGEVLLVHGGVGGPRFGRERIGCPDHHEASSCGGVVPLGDVDADGHGDAFLVWHDPATNDDHLTLIQGDDRDMTLTRRSTWAIPRNGE